MNNDSGVGDGNINDSNNINLRILIVEDDHDIALTFKIGLEDSGFVVDPYNDSVFSTIKFQSRYLQPVIARYQNAKNK